MKNWRRFAFAGSLALITPPRPSWAQDLDAGWAAETDFAGGQETVWRPEQTAFLNGIQKNQFFNLICKRLRARFKQRDSKVGVSLINGVVYTRSLYHLVSGKMGVVDQGLLTLPINAATDVAIPQNTEFIPISVEATLDGRSTVVRPLDSEKTCKEVDDNPALREIKTVLPVEAGRIADMKVGELWQIPLLWRLGASPGVSVPAGAVLGTVTIGYLRQGGASVTLYRLADDLLRFRLRLDRAEVRNIKGEVVGMIPIAQLGLPAAEKLLGQSFGPLAAVQINSWLGPRIGFEAVSTQDDRAFLEYTLDPRDPRQVAALTGLFRGDLDSLMALAARSRGLLSTEKKADEALKKFEESHKAIGSPNFAGLSFSKDAVNTLSGGLPMIFDGSSVRDNGKDTLVLFDAAGGRYTAARLEKGRNSGFLGLPRLGHVFERHQQRIAETVTYQDAKGVSRAPVAMYVQQESFMRGKAKNIEDMAQKLGSITRLAGTRGADKNIRAAAPLNKIFPQLPPSIQADDASAAKCRWHWSLSSFALLFDQKAVQDILAADAPSVLRAFAASLQGVKRAAMEWVIRNGRIAADGTIAYDKRALLEALGATAVWDAARQCRRAALFIADLIEARKASAPEAQAAAFTRIMAGRSPGRVSYEDAVRVFVQLVDPADLTGEFDVQMDKLAKGEKSVVARYLFNKGAMSAPLIRGIGRAKARFAPPSPISD